MASSKTAFITGITGQDGSYLAKFLLGKNYEVHGLVRWDCVDTTQRLAEFTPSEQERLYLHNGDMNDANNLTRLIKNIAPDEIYNLAALSHVKVSFETPASALNTNAGGTLNILESVRILDMHREVRIYQASSSEMFGSAPPPQDENTPMQPCSPYGVAKLAGYWLARTYRDAYGLHVSNGILFNHESPQRGEDFVTRKIASAVAHIESGRQKVLRLGNLDSLRDWGHARDYVRGMWMMLQQDCPDDYVLATGEAHSVRDFTEKAFSYIGVHLKWQDEGVHEKGICTKTGRVMVIIDPDLFRPKEVNALLGSAKKAQAKLGWQPENLLDDLVSEMVNAERSRIWKGDNEWMQAG